MRASERAWTLVYSIYTSFGTGSCKAHTIHNKKGITRLHLSGLFFYSLFRGVGSVICLRHQALWWRHETPYVFTYIGYDPCGNNPSWYNRMKTTCVLFWCFLYFGGASSSLCITVWRCNRLRYTTTLCSVRRFSDLWSANWEWFWRKWSPYNLGSIPAFTWRNWGKRWKTPGDRDLNILKIGKAIPVTGHEGP
jgi:hypothetical protein